MDLDVGSRSFEQRSLASVFRSRRSTRIFSEAPIEEVASVIRETLRIHFVGEGTSHGRKLKAVVSAGALHPVKAILLDRAAGAIAYDDFADCFLAVGVRDNQHLDAFLENCRKVLPQANGHWVALIADSSDLSRLYSHYQSLLWRDAGAVIQAMALVAEARDLAFCPLGILGQQVVDALLPGNSRIVPVGVAAIGKPSLDQIPS
ncbi:nitroreductase family protein [Mesorhizobium sp. B4-1-1]|uniref:nitroreductase family protein n=1 Tax=Mesorhizobium sp. B4-1-1 TaxID=2589890 RepID=UPI0015E3DBCC|nr:nitroreductase family protein [Mesorhizobium sp. B4-1-1]